MSETDTGGRAAPPTVSDETDLFLSEVGDVQPLSPSAAYVPRSGSSAPSEGRGRALALLELDDLVSGRTPFELSFNDEHVEGLARGVDRRLLRRLKKGEFSVAAHLDLHGRTKAEARPIVERFLQTCRQRGQRCILIVHGRGHHSDDQIPVLKESLTNWLVRGRIGRAVLAFCSARPADGGMGAVYVLLRK